MSAQSSAPRHIEITETLVRLYVFLAQHLDRCYDEASRKAFPEKDLQAHLSETKARMMEFLSVNRVVKGKVEKECDHVLSLATAYLKGGTRKKAVLERLRAERAVLQNKTIALSDLLAVFRAS